MRPVQLPPLDLLARSTAALEAVEADVGAMQSGGSVLIGAMLTVLRENVGLRVALNSYQGKVTEHTLDHERDMLKDAIRVRRGQVS
jgi:hypothetical protein